MHLLHFINIFIIFFLASVQHMTLFQVGIFGLKYRYVQCCSRPLDLYYSNNTAHHTVAFEACLVDGCCVAVLVAEWPSWRAHC